MASERTAFSAVLTARGSRIRATSCAPLPLLRHLVGLGRPSVGGPAREDHRPRWRLCRDRLGAADRSPADRADPVLALLADLVVAENDDDTVRRVVRPRRPPVAHRHLEERTARFRMSVCGRGARRERERIPARRSGWNPFESRDRFPRSPRAARLFERARVAAGLVVGRQTTAARTTAAPDDQTGGDSRPPNATPILKRALSHRLLRHSSAAREVLRSARHDFAASPVATGGFTYHR